MIERLVDKIKRSTRIDYTDIDGTFYKGAQVRNLSASESYRALL